MMTVIVIMMRHSMSDIVACDTDSDSETDMYSEMTRIILHNIYLLNIYLTPTKYHLSSPLIQSLQYSQSYLLPYMTRCNPLVDT